MVRVADWGDIGGRTNLNGAASSFPSSFSTRCMLSTPQNNLPFTTKLRHKTNPITVSIYSTLQNFAYNMELFSTIIPQTYFKGIFSVMVYQDTMVWKLGKRSTVPLRVQIIGFTFIYYWSWLHISRQLFLWTIGSLYENTMSSNQSLWPCTNLNKLGQKYNTMTSV